MIIHPSIEILLELTGMKWESEYRFHPKRRWRFDFAIPGDIQVAVEVEGATWARGRHTRGAGYAADCEKYNTAQTMGWLVLRFTTDMIKKNPSGVLDAINMALYARRK